jgi:hypothetical protein
MMPTSQPSDHILIWRDFSAHPKTGPNALLGWSDFTLSGGKFVRRALHAQLGDLATMAISQAIDRGVNVTVAWQPENPATASVDRLEEIFRKQRPATLVCPERAARRSDRWSVSLFDKPASAPAAAVQGVLNKLVTELYPRWSHFGKWKAHGLLVRHEVSAEELGLVEPLPPTPDDICDSVADDPQVREAFARFDRATPSTCQDLVATRLLAQARAGVTAEERAPLYSDDVDSYLMSIVMRMGRGEERATLHFLRNDLSRLYGPYAETVLQFMLRTYQHDGIDELREAARTAATTSSVTGAPEPHGGQ